MRRGSENLNDVVKANDVGDGAGRVEYDPRLFPGDLSDHNRFQYAIAALKRNFKCLSQAAVSEFDIRTQVNALLESRGFLAEFIHGNCELPLKKTDTELYHLSISFMYLVKLAVKMSNVKVLPAKRVAILACEFAKCNQIRRGAVDAVMGTIKDSCASRGASEHQRQLFKQLVTRLKAEKLIDSDYQSGIPDSLEMPDGSSIYREDRYHHASSWECDGDGNVVSVTCGR